MNRALRAMRWLAAGLAWGAAFACGQAHDTMIGARAASSASDDWPPVAKSPADAATVKTVLASADGAQVHVRAYLIAVTLPCPACNTNLGQRRSVIRQEGIGRARPPPPTPGPGCAPCPPPAATFSDEAPTASAGPAAAPLRAVGAAEGLQPRHMGHLFLLTGTFHPNGDSGPELEVTDVRALEGP